MERKSFIYRFDSVRVEVGDLKAFKAGKAVRLEPKAFEVLVYLIENRGRLIEKRELLDAVWKEAFVTENALTRVIAQLRRALGDDSKQAQYIETVPTRGYRFLAEVEQQEEPRAVEVRQDQEARVIAAAAERAQSAEGRFGWRKAMTHRRGVLIGGVVVLLLSGLGYWVGRRGSTGVDQGQIKSLAVLPFRSLNQEAKEDYLGLGIANDIITKVSQNDELTVRPTSAVRKYVNQEMDALAAARELQVDAVLDPTFLHVGDQLRVSVNLLRVADGKSLWTEKFDERFTDIFKIQDKVSQQVAERLRLKLSSAAQARLSKRYTANTEAYNYYTKAMYYFGGQAIFDGARAEIELFKKAIELDPNYALAHAQLGYAYAWTAVFKEDNPALIELAKQELEVAERLDPQLAEVHVARSCILNSRYEDWQVGAAIRELRLAQQLDPNVGHLEL